MRTWKTVHKRYGPPARVLSLGKVPVAEVCRQLGSRGETPKYGFRLVFGLKSISGNDFQSEELATAEVEKWLASLLSLAQVEEVGR